MPLPTQIPALSPSTINRQVRLIARPEGIPQAHHFALAEAAIPEPAEGQFRVRNIYLSVDPAQRGWASAEANYSQPVPLGSPMRALAIGVVTASRVAGVREGEYLYGWFGWQDHAVADPSAIILRANHALPLAQFGGLVGINGLTAYLALTRIGRPEAGDTLVVSTAAGGVGSLAGQIGKLMGCRTIGLTGSDDKVALCRSDYGYDAAFNYRTTDLAAALAQAAPGGINIYYDNVGGPILDTCLRQMAVAGRVVQCGTASVASWTPPPTGPRNEREILTRRLMWGGFVLFDHAAGFDAAVAQLADWYAQGRIDLRLEVLDGIEHAAGSIADLYAGRNSGKRLIRVG
ncbi:NADP-dependent oxidoreductase [Gemmobacter sp.]|uniref:NADP-dependent oxidoreductase n=1 Tax=Gemmobacter sp. TaxID=1898957 RepID=UPI002AFF9C5D|nr:NADP-dependent oxidoreductase [Gemmobacter sp.]